MVLKGNARNSKKKALLEAIIKLSLKDFVKMRYINNLELL